MFTPSHQLISRSRKTPVQLIPNGKGFYLTTAVEYQTGQEPAFEIRPRLGIYCKGTPIVGYRLEPLSAEVEATATSPVSTSSR
ncbi:MAG: hypothetical protein ACKO24_13080 [Leptolyngbyaceae cyanobacterium]